MSEHLQLVLPSLAHQAFPLISGVFLHLRLQPARLWAGVAVVLKASDGVSLCFAAFLKAQVAADRSRGQVARVPQRSNGPRVPRRD